jgi:hypothetical protein
MKILTKKDLIIKEFVIGSSKVLVTKSPVSLHIIRFNARTFGYVHFLDSKANSFTKGYYPSHIVPFSPDDNKSVYLPGKFFTKGLVIAVSKDAKTYVPMKQYDDPLDIQIGYQVINFK